LPPWWILCGNLILPMAIDYVYFYSIEFAKLIIRYRAVTALGLDYNTVQKRVNQILRAESRPRKSVDEVAREVIRGQWGNGAQRKRKLMEAGYDAAAVQRRVNILLRK
jgi:hypothetical protein